MDFSKLRKKNLDLAKQKIKDSIGADQLISQTINSLSETDKVINLLTKRLREWYSLYNPEFQLSHHEKYVDLIISTSKEDLLKESKTTTSMGADLASKDVDAIITFAKHIQSIYDYQKKARLYLEKTMKSHCPNFLELAGVSIGAKLLEHAGSLKKLVLMPASTIQILGAEKALFRHIVSGARPPKYGIIHDHSFIQGAKRSEQGKRARALADKLSFCVKLDYFKGEFKAKEFKKELAKKFGDSK